MKNKSGFTLVELMVTIAIMGILAGIGIPNFLSWMPNYRLRSAAREVKSVMQMARLRAVKENAQVVVSFDLANDTYKVCLDNAPKNGDCDDGESIVASRTMPAGVDLYEAAFPGPGGDPRCGFSSRGLLNVTDGHTYLRNSQNRYLGVAVRITGSSVIQTSTNGSSWSDV